MSFMVTDKYESPGFIKPELACKVVLFLLIVMVLVAIAEPSFIAMMSIGTAGYAADQVNFVPAVLKVRAPVFAFMDTPVAIYFCCIDSE